MNIRNNKQISFGKKLGNVSFENYNGLSKTDFSKLELTKNQQKLAEALTRKYNSNNDDFLDKNELMQLQTDLQKYAKDGVLGNREARKFLKDLGFKDLKREDIYALMQQLAQDNDDIQNAETKDSITTITHKPTADGVVVEDKFKMVNDKQVLQTQTRTNINESEGYFVKDTFSEDGTTCTKSEFYQNGKLSTLKEFNGNTTVTTCYEDGEAVSKVRKNGTVTEELDIETGKVTKRITDKGSGIVETIEFITDENGNDVEIRTVTGQEPITVKKDKDENVVPKETTTKLKVNYQDTWYGIVQAKYGISDHKQTMEIVRQLKAQNNVNPKATNMPSEIELLNNVTLKDGTEISLTNIDAEVDKSHFGYKTTSETGRYTITQNGKTKYYAADGTELKKSYYEAKEASQDKYKYSENGSGRYTYTADNGETYHFAADGTLLKKEYYERRETEYTAINSQKETVKNARQAFQQQLDSDGWAGKTADAVSVVWGSKNRASKVEADLQAYENQLQQLKQAQTKGAAEFNAKFKDIYGVEYNPANIAAYEANPTPENYKKAYGIKNDIHKRVMEYNKSQQDGAAAVKTTVVVAATTAAAIATGGASVAATAAIAGGSTMAARMIVETTDLASNNVDNDVMENLGDITKQAVKEGVIAGVTAGTMKGIANHLGNAAPKSVSTNAESTSALVRTETQTSQAVVKSTVNGSTSAAGSSTTAAGSAATGGGAVVKSTVNGGTSAAGSSTAATGSAAAGGSTAASAQQLNLVNNIATKLAGRGGIDNLTALEKSELAKILGKSVESIKSMPKSEYFNLLKSFHPDKFGGNDKFANVMFGIIQNLRL